MIILILAPGHIKLIMEKKKKKELMFKYLVRETAVQMQAAVPAAGTRRKTAGTLLQAHGLGSWRWQESTRHPSTRLKNTKNEPDPAGVWKYLVGAWDAARPREQAEDALPVEPLPAP